MKEYFKQFQRRPYSLDRTKENWELVFWGLVALPFVVLFNIAILPFELIAHFVFKDDK